jgi:hypothetical protein
MEIPPVHDAHMGQPLRAGRNVLPVLAENTPTGKPHGNALHDLGASVGHSGFRMRLDRV